MRVIRLFAGRAVADLTGRFYASVVGALFLVVTAALAVHRITTTVGGTEQVSILWAHAVEPFLSVLTAFLTCAMWREGLRAEGWQMLLTAPIHVRDIVLGRWLGAFVLTLILVGLSCLGLAWFSGMGSVSDVSSLCVVLPILMLQAATWCAVGCLMGAVVRTPSLAIVWAILVTAILPRGLYEILTPYVPALRQVYATYPFSAHISDAAFGTISLTALVFYPVVTICALCLATRAVSLRCFVGRGGRGRRLSALLLAVLSIVTVVLLMMVVVRYERLFRLPYADARHVLSPRAREVLRHLPEGVRVTCFTPRTDVAFRPAWGLLRALSADVASQTGVPLTLRAVDPRREGDAAALLRAGFHAGTIVFERGGRRTETAVEGFDEEAALMALRRVTQAAHATHIYFTQGHGETPLDDVSRETGFTQWQRTLLREGYILKTLSLPISNIPEDCAVLVVMGAKSGFSGATDRMIEDYLERGGRLLVLTSDRPNEGVDALLESKGLSMVSFRPKGVRTTDGVSVVADVSTEHVLTRPLAGTKVVFGTGRAAFVCKVPEKENMTCTVLAKARSTRDDTVQSVAVALEKGSGTSDDLGLRPMRIVVIGDTSFVTDGALASRVNANADFARNAVAWLAGVDAISGTGRGGVVSAGLTRDERLWFFRRTAGLWPLLVWVVLLLPVLRRHLR